MPHSNDVHTDAVLSNFAIQYRQDNKMFIGDKVSPVVNVSKESDKYTIYTKKDLFTFPSTNRADGAPSKEVDWALETEGTYQCMNYALKGKVTDRTVKNADKPISPMIDTQNQLLDLIMLDREKRVADQLFNTTTFASYYSALDLADRWDNYTSSDSDPIADIETARESVIGNSFKEPNKLILGFQVYQKLKHHPVILDRVKGGATVDRAALVTPRLLAEMFEVDEVLVGRAFYNGNNEGQTASYSYVWGKYALMAYINPSPMQLKNVTLSLSPQTQSFQTSKWYQQDIKSTWIEPEMIVDELVTCDACGYLFSTVIS